MLTTEENRLITLTGPGTPGGALMRCYWQPVALANEIPPGGARIKCPTCQKPLNRIDNTELKTALKWKIKQLEEDISK